MQKQIEFDENHDIEHIKRPKRKTKFYVFVCWLCVFIYSDFTTSAHEADEAMDCVETEIDFNKTKYQFNIYDYRFT